jgi:hypothetical protein
VSALPTRFVPVVVPFTGLFRQRTWRYACALLLGAAIAWLLTRSSRDHRRAAPNEAEGERA